MTFKERLSPSCEFLSPLQADIWFGLWDEFRVKFGLDLDLDFEFLTWTFAGQ